MVAPTAVMQRTGGADKCSEILKAIIITDTYKQSVSASDPRGGDIPHVLCLGSKLAVAALLCYGKIRPRYQEWHRRVCDVVIYMSLWDFKVLPPELHKHSFHTASFPPCSNHVLVYSAYPMLALYLKLARSGFEVKVIRSENIDLVTLHPFIVSGVFERTNGSLFLMTIQCSTDHCSSGSFLFTGIISSWHA